MEKLNIIFICTNADLAGAPIHVRGLILGLQHRANIQAVFGESGPIVEELKLAGIECHILARMRSKISPINDIISLYQLVRLIQKTTPNLVHLHSAKAGMIGRIACLLTGIPWVYTVHGWGWRGFGRVKSGLLFAIETILSIGSGGFYIFVSKSVEADALRMLKLSQHRRRVVYNGVQDIGAVPEPNGQLRILMAARVCNAKDHETLVRAFDRLNIQSKLVLCGQDTDSDYFRNLVHTWAPHRYSDIELLGVCKDVPKLLQLVNIFALISHFEALPISIIEAMASGRAVIASDVGGVTELIDQNTSGLTIPHGSVQKLADGLISLQDANYRTYLARNARMRYESHFSEFDMLEAVWKIYLEATHSS